LTNLQAAVGLAQFEQLKDFIKIKKKNYELYKKLLSGLKGIDLLGIPQGTAPNYWFYSLVINKEKFGMDREGVMKHLEAKGIQTRPIWFLNHLQRPYLKNQAYRIENASWFWQRVLNLPCSTNLNIKQIKYIASTIRGLSTNN
ncbi:MAG: DegT/DnrJ/EryC1/StrS family aminotransferase, partial [Candidatus Omnitrophota bacterium]